MLVLLVFYLWGMQGALLVAFWNFLAIALLYF